MDSSKDRLTKKSVRIRIGGLGLGQRMAVEQRLLVFPVSSIVL